MFPVTLSFNIASADQLAQIGAIFASLGQPAAAPKSVTADEVRAEREASGGSLADAKKAAEAKKEIAAKEAAAKKQAAIEAQAAVEQKQTQTSAASSASSSNDTQPADQVDEDQPSQAGVMYAIARELVLKLAATHREDIKKINAKHGIAKLSALLEDENDFGSVTDQAKLDAVYADLQAIGA